MCVFLKLRRNIMKNFLILFTALISIQLPLISYAQPNKEDPSVVANLDLLRFSGFWFEVARTPSFFQRNCINSTAEYSVINSASISVLNTCCKKNGKASTIDGVAKIVDERFPAKLKLSFSFFQKGDYWITELDPNYQWAVISAPGKKFIYILSRVSKINENEKNLILNILRSKNYDVDQLIYDIR